MNHERGTNLMDVAVNEKLRNMKMAINGRGFHMKRYSSQ